MGWNEGQGLGRANQGITKPIEVSVLFSTMLYIPLFIIIETIVMHVVYYSFLVVCLNGNKL